MDDWADFCAGIEQEKRGKTEARAAE